MTEDTAAPDIRELYGEFIEECRELMEGMAMELVALEKSPSDEELVNKVFRFAHSLKGNAGFIGLTGLSELAHKMENVLGKIRDKEFPFFPEINDVLFKGLDIAKGILADFTDGSQTKRDLTGIYSELEALLHGASKDESRVERSEGEGSREKRREDEDISFMRVSTSRLDRLVNLVGELAAGKSRLMQISKEIRSKPLEEVTGFITSVSSQIQAEVLSIRMVPIKQLFNRFYRLVRDISRPMGKEVELKVYGEETELDKTIVEILHAPLMHMVRNSIGHGIESPEERRKKGKPEKGTIVFRASHERNYVHIDVEDDGKGLDPLMIKKKAMEKGLIDENEAAALTDEDAVRLVFRSGFSTSETIDDISGRGVGLDVVKTHVKKLGGSIDVEFKEGEGTRFLLKMPLTVAIVQIFLLKEAGYIYGIPLSYVDETIRVRVSDIEHIKGQRIHMLRHHPIPILGLREVLRLKSTRDHADIMSIVVVRLFQKRVGFIVDDFMGKVETVIKPLGKYIENLPDPVEGITGAAILGTGDIVLILDVPSLYKGTA